VPTLLPPLLYLVAAALALVGSLRQATGWGRLSNFLGLLGLSVQGWLFAPAWPGMHAAPSLTLADAAALVGAAVALVTLIGAWRGHLGGATVALWLTAGLLALGDPETARHSPAEPMGLELLAHILLSAAAAGLLSVAAILVLLLAAQSARLRSRRPLGMLAILPPLESLENAVFSTVMAGFIALSLSLLSGVLFIEDLFAQHLVHKTVLSLTAWCIFGVLLLGRHRFGWRGRQALRFLLAGYVTLALAYFGSRFVLEALLGRHWG
jgi:ABC-type uncharacterized transport system permease subunit